MSSSSTKGWTQRSADDWRLLLTCFAESGLSVTAFCQREAISSTSFYRWRRTLEAAVDGGHQRRPPPAFVDLGPLGASIPSSPRLEVKLDLGGGVVLHLVRG